MAVLANGIGKIICLGTAVYIYLGKYQAHQNNQLAVFWLAIPRSTTSQSTIDYEQ